MAGGWYLISARKAHHGRLLTFEQAMRSTMKTTANVISSQQHLRSAVERSFQSGINDVVARWLRDTGFQLFCDG